MVLGLKLNISEVVDIYFNFCLKEIFCCEYLKFYRFVLLNVCNVNFVVDLKLL